MLKRTLIMAICLSLAANSVAAQGKTKKNSTPEAPKRTATTYSLRTLFDIDFPGGTLESLVKAIEVQLGARPNVILLGKSGQTKIPAFSLRSVSVENIFNALIRIPWASGANESLTVSTNSKIISVATRRYTNMGRSRSTLKRTEIFDVKGLLAAKYTINDIVTAMETAWKMEDTATPKLKYHAETSLLIIRASLDQLMVAEKVIKQIQKQLSEKKKEKTISELQRKLKSLQKKFNILSPPMDKKMKESLMKKLGEKK